MLQMQQVELRTVLTCKRYSDHSVGYLTLRLIELLGRNLFPRGCKSQQGRSVMKFRGLHCLTPNPRLR